MSRLTFLRQQTTNTTHGIARICIPDSWQTKGLPVSLAQRKAYAIKAVLDNMPVWIGEEELIVGTRSVYGKTEKTGENLSEYDYWALPHYVNETDISYFGYNQEFISKAHYTPAFDIVINSGINNLCKNIEKTQYQLDDQKEFADSVLIVYKGLVNLIDRYADEALMQAHKSKGKRKEELHIIAENCRFIKANKPETLMQAAQLYWFLYLACIIENFQFVNYGRIDQILNPFISNESDSEIKDIMGCLILKMYDQYDLILVDKNLMGRFSAQHNITIGGKTRDGQNACNRITKGILEALKITNLPEPLISVRVSKDSPEWYMRLAADLTVNGMNCMAYYNDELVTSSLINAGINTEDARDYAFGLCQDILIPGRGDHYCCGGTNLTLVLLKTLKDSINLNLTYDEFFSKYIEDIKNDIDKKLTSYNYWEEAIKEYNQGNKDLYFKYIEEGKIIADEPARGLNAAQAARNETDELARKELYIQSLMSPLPFTSSLYHGCMESGTDITRCGCINKDKGYMLLGPVIAFNSLAALKLNVFIKKLYTLAQINEAMENNWENNEIMRQRMWNTEKWCNDIDFVDNDAVILINKAAKQIQNFPKPYGGHYLSGIHQPHPVFAGRSMPATPEGRFSGTPIPVTLSPENGTLKDGPAGALKSAAKINHFNLQWNSCVMLQYYSSTFDTDDGSNKFISILNAYHKLGGIQHQPNVVDLEQLKDAQIHPEEYKDLIIRMWGVSAHFVDLPKDVQDEFISRFD